MVIHFSEIFKFMNLDLDRSLYYRYVPGNNDDEKRKKFISILLLSADSLFYDIVNEWKQYFQQTDEFSILEKFWILSEVKDTYNNVFNRKSHEVSAVCRIRFRLLG